MVSETARLAEKQFFESEKKKHPELFIRQPLVDDIPHLQWIGIESLSEGLPIGYIKLYPQDFIVEEISGDGALRSVETGELFKDLTKEGQTHYADLVKISLSTFDACDAIAQALGIERKSVSYSGIKDRQALTSQKISLRNVPDIRKAELLANDYFFLKNIESGKGAVSQGDLQGNRFTIAVRLIAPLTEIQLAKINEALADIKQNGFWNFYSFQRFGTPRLLSHRLGRLLLRGEYENVLKTFFTTVTDRELPYFQNLRRKMLAAWGAWESLKEIIAPFPVHFEMENIFVDYLLKNPADFLGALRQMPEQIKLWFYAYDSYLFNRKLSELIAAGEVPEFLPMANSFNQFDRKPYEKFLQEDGVILPNPYYRDFPFIRVESRRNRTTQPAEIIDIAASDHFVFFSFSLPKGAYATSFLMNFFILASGLPVPAGISFDQIDPKSSLGLGSLQPVLEKFQKVLSERAVLLEGSEE